MTTFNTLLILQATLPEVVAQSMKRAKENNLTMRSVSTAGLDMNMSMPIRRFCNEHDSFYVLHGQGDNDSFSVQGNQLTLRSTIPSNPHMLFLLKQMLEACSEDWMMDVSLVAQAA